MSVAPYVPMRKPGKAVTQEDMWETLAKHTKPQVEIHLQNAGESPKEKAPLARLEWQTPVRTSADGSTGYVVSVCGRYAISKDRVRGATMYTASRVRRPDEPILLGIRTTRADAEALCNEAHRRE